MTRSTVALAVVLTACTMPNPAFEAGELDEAADALDGSTSEDPSSSDTSVDGAATLDADTSESDSLDTNPSDTNPGDTEASDTSPTGNAACGNGIIEEGEACDDGNPNDGDDCTNLCMLAVCGDGFLHDGVEQCDDGDTDDSDACTSECVAASCGDGFVQVGEEECDDGNLTKLDGCDEACALEFRYVFVTSMLIPGGMIGGVAGADEFCNLHANQAQLPGKYLAWISDGQTSPASRFPESTVPYKTPVHFQHVAENWADLTDGSIGNAIATTETGGNAPFASAACGSFMIAWTGTNNDGTAAEPNCEGFTQFDAVGRVGTITAPMSSWSYCGANSVTCATLAPLYCFQK